VLALLADLIERRARRVGRDELARRLWPGSVVSASSFSTLVAELRKALGDDGRRQAVIRTLGPHGYRFVAEVRMDAGARADAPALTAAHRAADRSLERALRDGPRHLDVAGPGAGAFVDHWASTARDRGILVVRAHALGEPTPPLWPWWQIGASVCDVLAEPGTDGPAPAPPDSLRPAWQRVWAELDALARGPHPRDPVLVRQHRFALAHHLASALARTARSLPCALVLEDLAPHDRDSFRLLRFALVEMRRSPLWIVTSSRSPPTPPSRAPDAVSPRTDLIRLPSLPDAP